MTKKDYVLIAEVLKNEFRKADGAGREIIAQVIKQLSLDLKAKNPAFNEEKFYNYINQ